MIQLEQRLQQRFPQWFRGRRSALVEESDGTLRLLAHNGRVLREVIPRLRLVMEEAPRRVA